MIIDVYVSGWFVGESPKETHGFYHLHAGYTNGKKKCDKLQWGMAYHLPAISGPAIGFLEIGLPHKIINFNRIFHYKHI